MRLTVTKRREIPERRINNCAWKPPYCKMTAQVSICLTVSTPSPPSHTPLAPSARGAGKEPKRHQLTVLFLVRKASRVHREKPANYV